MYFDIFFLGKLFSKEIEIEVKNKMKTGMPDAANALQWNIINGIDEIIFQLPVDGF